MLAVYHSIYLYHDLIILLNLKAVEGVGTQCHERGKESNVYVPGE